MKKFLLVVVTPRLYYYEQKPSIAFVYFCNPFQPMIEVLLYDIAVCLYTFWFYRVLVTIVVLI